MRSARPLLGSLIVLLYGYLADLGVDAAFDEASVSGDFRLVVPAAAVARVVGIGLVVALAWLVVRGPRQARIMAGMVIIGLYFALAPAVVIAIAPNADLSVMPLALAAHEAWAHVLAWMSAGVAVLGIIGLAWPSVEPG
jgi:hypothetical protein